MIKIFCDFCGVELERNFVSRRFMPKLKNIVLEVLVSVNKVWNSGHLCSDCIKKIVAEGKE